MRRGVLILLALTGCLEPDLVPCGDLSCPAGNECREGACVSKDSIAKCEGAGLAEGSSCTADDGRAGRCIAGACTQATCGDGYVDPDVREACDGTTTAQCVDFGFDLGRASCTDCAIDTAPCVRFGWRRIAYTSSNQLWTNGTIVAYTEVAPFALHIEGGGFAVDAGEGYADVRGGGQRVFVLDQFSHLFEAHGTALTPIYMDAYINSFDVSDDGTPYIVVGCTVLALGSSGTWQPVGASQPVPDGYCSKIRVGGAGSMTQVYVVSSTSAELYRLSGTGFVGTGIINSSSVSEMRIHGNELWVGTAGGGVNRYTLGTSTGTKVITGEATSFAFIGRSTYIGLSDGTLVRYNGRRIDRMRGPTGGRVTDDGHGGLYMYRGPIYRFSGIGYGELPSPPLDANDRIVASVRTPTGVVAQSEQYLYYAAASGDGWTTAMNPSAPAPMTSISGTDQDHLVVAASYMDDHSQVLMSTDPATWQLIDESSTVSFGVWMAPDRTVVAVGIDDHGAAAETAHAQFGVYPAGSTMQSDWQIFLGEAGCRGVAVHGTDATHLVAAGRCGDKGVVWERKGDGTWAEIYRSPADDSGFRAVLRTADGKVFASGDRGTSWFDGTWHTDPTAIGRTLSGTAADLWLSGAFTNVQHFDGTSWSQVQTSALSEIAVAVGVDDVVFPGGSPGHVNLIRDPDVVP